MIWHPFLLSLQVTAVATSLILVVGLSLAWLLARRRFPAQTVVETLINLPFVLPPSVVGYYLLLGLGRGSPVVEWWGIHLLFTWWAATVASAVVGLPLMVQAARAAMFWRVTLPLARRGILAGLVLGATRALGEFGATLMIAGNMPGRTQTLPLAIYDAVQNQHYALAHGLALVMTT